MPGVTRSFHFRFVRVEQRGRVRLPGLDAVGRRGAVRHGGGEVLVGEAREVVAELVHEDVGRPEAVGRDGAVEAEDPAAAVGARVRQDLDELVRREGRHVAERPVVESQDVALRAEGVVGRADAGAAVDAGRGPRDPRLLGGRTERPDVEVRAALLEGRDREEHVGEPPRVLLELSALGRRVAVAEDQEVDLVRRVARLLDLEQRPGRWPASTRRRTCPSGRAGSVQISRKALRASRFFTTIWTGPSGAGKRSDSEKVRRCVFASAVVSHSP